MLKECIHALARHNFFLPLNDSAELMEMSLPLFVIAISNTEIL